MVKSKISEIIKHSPYKREYIEKHLGVSRNTLSNWCTGRTFPSVPQIIKLSGLLNVKFEDMYEEEKNEK
ncbi:helix-turn-helix transcriptional regulator [Bacillus sp. ISL-46]|uniref:helix-turn-helix transcriptional regulator n=1 Tax=Bacillus sp. ISL-46 TaxID=2819129 RepID=UPI001BE8B747|nr:helix-turn-helix transcriptional regulator [Bacillus sp. ISL-46]MBT2723035.1 helix-turn-helix transcriptional regulator [Bacillus sp. ISL-46]